MPEASDGARGDADRLAALLRERERAEQRLTTAHAITRVLAESTDLRDAIDRILRIVCAACRWEWSAFWAPAEGSRGLRCEHVAAIDGFDGGEFEQISRTMTLRPGLGLPGRVYATARPYWVSDVQEDPGFPRRPAARRAGLHGGFAFPIAAAGGRMLGVMEFFARHVEPPDEALLDMMASVGRQIGQFIERRRADDALRRSEARHAAIVAAALDCIVSMNHQGRVTEWNPAAERTFGYTRAEALGREMAELIIPPMFRDAHRNGLARYLATGEAMVIGKHLELTAVRKDGSEFPVELAITRIATDGPPMFTGHLRDITQRMLAADEREKLLRAEQHARAEAERANRLKDEFLATVSHELRTPLNAILGYAQLLRHAKVDPDVAEGLEVIERSARAQGQIIEDILDMSRIITGKLRLDVQRVDLPEVIQAAVETVRPAADGKGIRLVTTLDPLAGPVAGDPGRLQQVVWNLLANGIKFTPRGGRVQVILRRVNSHVEIAVSDTGQGIAPEFLPHVFDKFRQADASTARRHGGLGLGLSIVRSLVDGHGGSVRVSSAGEGKGATFVVELPISAVHEEPPGPDAGRRHPTAEPAAGGGGAAPCAGYPSLAGITVLAVDDEHDARELVRKLLEECQCRVLTASNVDEAIAVMDREKVDVVLSDIGMPVADGYDLIRRVRARPREQGGNVPAAALTAFARSEDRTRALLAGYQTHVAKPVEAQELAAAVATLARLGGRSR